MQKWRWRAASDMLPEVVRKESSRIDLINIVFYPYWLLDVDVDVKAPFLAKTVRRWIVAIDALTTAISVPPPTPPVLISRDDYSVRTCYLEPKVAPSDLDLNRLKRMAVDQVGRKLRSWMNVTTEVNKTRLVHKELRVFYVTFANDSRATLALDSLTGEYGIVKGENWSELAKEDQE